MLAAGRWPKDEDCEVHLDGVCGKLIASVEFPGGFGDRSGAGDLALIDSECAAGDWRGDVVVRVVDAEGERYAFTVPAECLQPPPTATA